MMNAGEDMARQVDQRIEDSTRMSFDEEAAAAAEQVEQAQKRAKERAVRRMVEMKMSRSARRGQGLRLV